MTDLIVVGIDGSETSRLASLWAAHEAQLRGADLHLVCAWEIPASDFAFSPTGVSEDVMKVFRSAAEEILGEATEDVRHAAQDVNLSTQVVQGQAAQVLTEASRAADLLVVGSRGLGGFRELLLGSISQQCADHARCPVVIVRHTH